MRVWTLMLFLLFRAGEPVVAQTDYFELKELVMEASMEQPLAVEFKASYPELFDNDNCPPSFNHQEPTPADLKLKFEPTEEQTREAVNILLRNDCDRFITLDALSDYYFPALLDKLSAAGLSQDYKYLPLILSGLNPLFDNGANEVGAWQLNFVTARKFGLLVDSNIDERKDFSRSTDAAIDYLIFLEKKFRRSPEKVILAFAHSPLYVTKSYGDEKVTEENLRKTDAQLLASFITARGLFESMETADHRQKIADFLKNRKPTPYTYSLSFESIATVLNADQKKIELMNPVFVKHKLDSTYSEVPFVLEEKKSAAFEILEDSIYSFERIILADKIALRKAEEERLRKNIPDPKTSTELIYKVRAGDVLGKIADRYGLSINDIRSWNNISGNTIYVGQELVLYVPNSKITTEEKSVVEKKKSSGTPGSEEKDLPKGDYITYTVKNGDSLWLIARNYPGVSAENIMQWNDISEDIRPGTKLKIYLQK